VTYVWENDEVHPTIPRSTAATVWVWPKVAGRLVAAGSGAYAIRMPEGGDPIASGTIAGTDVVVGSETVTRYSVPIPAIDVLDEDYQLEVSWTSDGGESATARRLFDVGVTAMPGTVTVNDIDQTLWPVLERYGRARGAPDAEAARLLAIREYATRARVKLQGKLWSRADADGKPRVHMRLDDAQVGRVETLYAMAEITFSDAPAPEDGTDMMSQKFRAYARMADQELEALRIAWAEDEERVPLTSTFGRSYTIQRVQG